MKREERKVKRGGRAAFAARFLNCAGKMREARGKMHLAGKGGRRQTADMKTDGKRNGFFRHAALLALAGVVAGCSGMRTYAGRVVDADTGEPIPGASIEGTYYRRGRFAPSLDGVFLRIPVRVQTVTDENGAFTLHMRKEHLSLWVVGPEEISAYKHSTVHWRIDEKNPRGILVRLEKWEKKHGKP